MSAFASPSPFFPPSQSNKKGVDQPIQNPLLMRKNSVVANQPLQQRTSNRHHEQPAVVPTTGVLRNRKKKQVSFIPPPTASIGLGTGVDVVQNLLAQSSEGTAVKTSSLRPATSSASHSITDREMTLAQAQPFIQNRSNLLFSSSSMTNTQNSGRWVLFTGPSCEFQDWTRELPVLCQHVSRTVRRSNFCAVEYDSDMAAATALAHGPYVRLENGNMVTIGQLHGDDPLLDELTTPDRSTLQLFGRDASERRPGDEQVYLQVPPERSCWDLVLRWLFSIPETADRRYVL